MHTLEPMQAQEGSVAHSGGAGTQCADWVQASYETHTYHAASQSAQLGTYSQSGAGTHGPQQSFRTDGTWPVSHDGGMVLHSAWETSQSNPTLHWPALHCAPLLELIPWAVQVSTKHVAIPQSGADSPGPSATQLQQSE